MATAIGSMGLAAGGTAGALLARELTGSAAAAGLPLGVLVAGSAAGALVISSLSSRRGRGPGLVLGYVVGTAGAVTVIGGAVAGSFALVLTGSAALGGANAGAFLTRSAAADLGGPAARGRALGAVFFASSLGAVVGPNLLDPSGALAAAAGLPRLAGLYLVAVPSFVLAGLLLAVLARRHATFVRRSTIARKAPRGQMIREVAAGLTGALVDQASGLEITIVLGLLGVGWNAAVVGASTMLVASAPAALRPRVEGVGELAMGVAAAAGAPAAGLLVAVGGFTALCALGAAAAALALTTVRWNRRNSRRLTTATN